MAKTKEVSKEKIKKAIENCFDQEGIVTRIANIYKVTKKYTFDYKAYFLQGKKEDLKNIIEVLKELYIVPIKIDNQEDLNGNIAIYFS